MNKEQDVIIWVTPEYFMDPDVFVIRHLSAFYQIYWYIIRSGSIHSEYDEDIEYLKQNGVNVIIFQICAKSMDLKNLQYFISLAKTVRASGSKLVYLTLSYPFYFLPVMAHYIGVNKITLAIHNVHVPKGGSLYFRNQLYNFYAIHRFRHFQVFSQNQCDCLKKRSGGKDVRYIPFFLKDFGLPARPKKESKYVTFLNFGYIRDYKRLDVLIMAAQRAYINTGIYFKVIIAGSCSDWDHYQSMIKYDELFDLRIRHIHNKEIADLFAEADYFVAPYQDIAQSGAAIVALNYETPIIASRLPAFQEYIIDQETGYFINPADSVDLQEKIEYILKNHKRIYPQMIDALRRNNEKKFSAEAIVNSYKELINEFIKQ